MRLYDCIPPRTGFLNTNWTMMGDAPMKRGLPFWVQGINKDTKTLAAFLGLVFCLSIYYLHQNKIKIELQTDYILKINNSFHNGCCHN